MNRLSKLLELVERSPDDADLHFMIAQEHVNAGDWSSALPFLTRYVAGAGDVGAGWALAATCHERLGQVEEAAAALRSGIENARRNAHSDLAGELEDRLDELT